MLFSATLLSMVPTIENYSIDESFLNLGEFREREVEPLARELRERVQRWVGIPTCVGIASTKTLAKVANFIAKKRPQYRGVCDLRSRDVRADLLSTVPVDEVWGIGAASRSRPGRRCARPSRATRREQRRRCAGTKWPPRISSSSCTRVPSTMTRSIQMERRRGFPRRPTTPGKSSLWPCAWENGSGATASATRSAASRLRS